MTLLGARNLDPPEVEFIAAAGIRTELGDLPELIYVALDGDVIDPGDARRLRCRSPAGSCWTTWRRCSRRIPRPVGAGFTGFTASERNEQALPRLGHALGL